MVDPEAVFAADVIVAPATPSGRSALAVVRLSGAGAHQVVASRLAGGRCPPARRASLRWLVDANGDRIDQVVVLRWVSPASYTGEDVVELSLHGNPLLVRRVCLELCEAGARMAEPGEFTRRAVLNGRLRLSEAEAVADIIEARTPRAASVAARNVGGALGLAVGSLRDQTMGVIAELEAAIDHPEEQVEGPDEDLLHRTWQVAHRIAELRAGYEASQSMLRARRLVLTGPVNAGKSTLFNALLGSDRAITSDEPGTTRDLLESTLTWDGTEVVVVDTAGWRADPAGSVEQEGQRRAAQARDSADVVLALWPWSERASAPAVVAGEQRIWTMSLGEALGPCEDGGFAVSAKEGLGMDGLRALVLRYMADEHDEIVVTTLRQERGLREAERQVEQAAGWIAGGEEWVLAAESLHEALAGLQEVIGGGDREQVLDEVFRRFCIGK